MVGMETDEVPDSFYAENVLKAGEGRISNGGMFGLFHRGREDKWLLGLDSNQQPAG